MLKLEECHCIVTVPWLSKSISFLNTKLIIINEFLKIDFVTLMLRRMLAPGVTDKQVY